MICEPIKLPVTPRPCKGDAADVMRLIQKACRIGEATDRMSREPPACVHTAAVLDACAEVVQVAADIMWAYSDDADTILETMQYNYERNVLGLGKASAGKLIGGKTEPCGLFEGRPMPDKPAPVREQPEYFVGMADGCEKVSVSHEKAPVSDDNAERDKRPMGAHSVREKGCAYCCDDYATRRDLAYHLGRGRIGLVRPLSEGAWILRATGPGPTELRAYVGYCPMCGRKLT